MRCLTAAFGFASTPTRAGFIASDLGHGHLLVGPLSPAGIGERWTTHDQGTRSTGRGVGADMIRLRPNTNEPVEVPCLHSSRPSSTPSGRPLPPTCPNAVTPTTLWAATDRESPTATASRPS